MPTHPACCSPACTKPAVAAMRMVDVDIAAEQAEVLRMCCGDACPVCPRTTFLDRDLDHAAGQGSMADQPIATTSVGG